MGETERLFRGLVQNKTLACFIIQNKSLAMANGGECTNAIIYVILLFISAFISSVNRLTFEISRKQETEKLDAGPKLKRTVNATAKRRKAEMKGNDKKMINVLAFVRNALTQTHIGY